MLFLLFFFGRGGACESLHDLVSSHADDVTKVSTINHKLLTEAMTTFVHTDEHPAGYLVQLPHISVCIRVNPNGSQH